MYQKRTGFLNLQKIEKRVTLLSIRRAKSIRTTYLMKQEEPQYWHSTPSQKIF